MKKILIVAHNIRFIVQFELNNIHLLQKLGYEVHCAVNYKDDHVIQNAAQIVNNMGVHIHQIDCARSPVHIIQNIKALNQLVGLIRKEKYSALHCHTPIGGVLGRIAGKITKIGTVIYTVHGFHFYRGSSAVSWMIYFPIEWLCSFFTDVLITINQEDYNFAIKHMHAGKIEYVPGVGINLKKLEVENFDKSKKRKELKISPEDTWILSVGELTKNKNHASLIKAIKDIPSVYLTIAGTGTEKDNLTRLINDLELMDRVKLIGYRNDTSELCHAADVFAFPSYREGLSVALMEAMACKMPIACSRIRGNVDLIDCNGGELFNPSSAEEIADSLKQIVNRNWENMGTYNRKKIEKFSLRVVMRDMKQIYKSQFIEN